MSVRIFGKKTAYTGNLLFEILSNLKNYGVGRVVLRNSYKVYPETSFYIIKKVVPLREFIGEGPEELLYGKVWVDEVFRDRKLPGLQLLTEVTWLPDFQLISREDEDFFLNFKTKEKTVILPKYDKLPPLLAQVMKKQMGYEPKLELVYENLSEHLLYKIAEEGEEPNYHTKIEIPEEYLIGVQDKRKLSSEK